jgi:Phage phiEco32-like COOH.NH2 ligase-type 2
MDINGVRLTVGADPEVFVGKNGNFISAHDLIKGNKRAPSPVNYGAVQVDGMALEFNIDPASSAEEFEFNIGAVQSQLKSMIGDLDFLPDSSVFFDEEFMKEIPQRALELGCEPDYNAYTFIPNERPNAGTLMRTAGGHIHVGGFSTDDPFNPTHEDFCKEFIKLLDKTIGVYSVLWDRDDLRRNMYGKAGCYRPKSYGVEYRTPSNAWIFNKKLINFVYKGVQEAAEHFLGVKPIQYDISSEEARYIIDNSKRKASFFKRNEKAEEIYGLIGA